MTSKAIINSIGITAKPVKRVSLSVAIANLIHDEWRVRKFADTSERHALTKKLAKDFDRRNYSRDKRKATIRQYFDAELISWQGWTQKQKIAVGYALLWLFARSLPGMLAISHNGQVYQPGKILLHQVQKVLAAQAGSWTIYPPMVVKPTPWSETNLFRGGYLSDLLRYPIIKRAKKADLPRFEAMDWSTVIPALNALQETGYRVNPKMLEALRWAFRDYDRPIGKMPAMSDIPLQARPWDYYHDETVKKAHNLRCYLIRDRQSPKPWKEAGYRNGSDDCC